MITGKEHLEQFFKLQSLRFGKCLEPTMKCENKAIRAHSIQNSRVIDLLAIKGHVISPQIKVSRTGPKIRLRLIGRNKASTFTGLCETHDAAIFQEIDTQTFDLSNTSQLFLLAYRSVTRELHATMEAAIKIQSAYMSRVERGIDSENEPSAAGMEAIGHCMNSYETYQYRANNFDKALILKRYDDIHHEVIILNEQAPVLAVSSLFSFANLQRGNNLVRCALNVVPTSNDMTVIVFSYTKKDGHLARSALERILSSRGELQKYEISKLIIDRVENFILSPMHFKSWDNTKTRKIEIAFASNVLSDDAINDDPDFMLF